MQNRVFEITYPLDIPEKLPAKKDRTTWRVDITAAINDLNTQLRLYGIKHAELKLDAMIYKDEVSKKYIVKAKRYVDDALLIFTKDGKEWELYCRTYFNISGNVMGLAQYIEHLRKMKKHRIEVVSKEKVI